ncbi:proteasome subunit beta [Glycomyces sp. NRRL B-16210]|uniref:proteasome subunit beta n=1 Tax=Glycomyces sp. NRRL B-16210 TaxID=1463821 RepID=UPI000690529A|nr:proteasome subunit beta [Glycomyces sp. NRRL B-16210]
MTAGTSSFSEFLTQVAPELVPGRRPLPPGDFAEVSAHATTIVALRTAEGVVMAGDRRATMGNYISSRDIEKVFPADGYSLVGIAGTAGLGLELVKLYQLELEHYEKIEGAPLTLSGKANRLATMLRGNLGIALQGLAVVPLFAGFDLDAASVAEAGKIYSFDVVGGIYAERDFDSIGSGSIFAKSSLKKRYHRDIATDDAVKIAVESLYDAADDDSATGGPDPTRDLYPVVMTATVDGAKRIDESTVAEVARAVIAARTENPYG